MEYADRKERAYDSEEAELYLASEADELISKLRMDYEHEVTMRVKAEERVVYLEEVNRKLRELNELLQARDDYVAGCLV